MATLVLPARKVYPSEGLGVMTLEISSMMLIYTQKRVMGLCLDIFVRLFQELTPLELIPHNRVPLRGRNLKLIYVLLGGNYHYLLYIPLRVLYKYPSNESYHKF